ncbi:hypothetical protein HMPREF1544_02469 [Mucor circinelloides 1006PhL]|uniref:Uncharacterized protein n=1 Tax=Mucor circinelloides f. circinelloides (strain 1006PhL) TaxID=1220926 RepID=S2JL89_MUCC1|nr:hypothetical protein HMPREF1544_02469 [Mucor circinelloides 1006PhL]
MEIDLNNFKAIFESVQALHKHRNQHPPCHYYIAILVKPVRSSAPAPAPAITADSTTATVPAQQATYPQDQPQQPRTQSPSWVKIIQRPASGTNKRRREHAIRSLQPPRTATDTPSYYVLHLRRSHRMSHVEYRSTLAAIIGINSRRHILDITFPARNVSTILIYVNDKDESSNC